MDGWAEEADVEAVEDEEEEEAEEVESEVECGMASISVGCCEEV